MGIINPGTGLSRCAVWGEKELPDIVQSMLGGKKNTQGQTKGFRRNQMLTWELVHTNHCAGNPQAFTYKHCRPVYTSSLQIYRISHFTIVSYKKLRL